MYSDIVHVNTIVNFFWMYVLFFQGRCKCVGRVSEEFEPLGLVHTSELP